MLEPLSYMPNAEQELLLKASLFDGEPALDAWNAWRRRVALDDADFASQRLMPLLLDNLERHGVDDPELGRYRSVARHVWLENQLHLHHAKRVLTLLGDAHIPAMALKGLAVATLYYGNPKLRGMGDIDILVPFASVRDAVRLLTEHGWRCQCDVSQLTRDALVLSHAVAFTNAQGASLDLHWHISHECCWPEADDAFWRHAQTFSLAGIGVRTLSHTDQLLHACIHGGRPCEMSPIRWVADGAFILRKAEIDWQRLFAQAKEFQLVRRLQRTLGYLRNTMQLPIPEAELAQLMAIQPTRLERLEEHVMLSASPNPLKSVVRRYVHYRRNVAEREANEGFLRHLEKALGTESFPETVLWVIRRLVNGRAGSHPSAL